MIKDVNIRLIVELNNKKYIFLFYMKLMVVYN